MQDQVIQALNLYAYNPMLVYTILFLVMYASSFGLPIPEELTLLTVGFLVFMGMNPDLFPVPVDGTPLNLHITAVVCLVAVFSSDLLVFVLGKKFGRKIIQMRFFSKFFNSERMDKIERWTNQYGKWACGLFRFTPGLRFPGHLSCGMLGLKTRTFVLVDGAMVLISVPTQIYAVAFFGNEILGVLKQFKIGLVAVLVVYMLLHFRHRIFSTRTKGPATSTSNSDGSSKKDAA